MQEISVIDLFVKLLSSESITPDDGGLLDYIEEYLSDFKAYRYDREGVKNLFLVKEFGSGGEHLCFGGHVDVVPAGDGWDSNPFVPKIDGDKIYARGAQDMKSGVAAFVAACRDIKDFNGTLSIILTSDEEGEGKFGTKIVLEELKKIDMLPNYAIIAEPTCESQFGDSIKVGRRGSINGVIELFGVQGHAAYPEKSVNVVNLISPILPRIAGYNLDNGDNNFAPSKFVITDIRAGMEVTNITPGYLKMMFNVRNSTNTTKEDVEEFVNSHFKELDYKLTLSQTAKPFVTDNSSKVVTALSKSIEDIAEVKPKLSTAGGTSDARFFGEFGVDTVEFGVINDTIHAPNEFTTITQVNKLYEVFKNLLKEF